MRINNKKAFTLIEIMIAVGIVGVLAGGIAAHNYVKARETTRTNICRENRNLVERGEQMYTLDEGRHSASIGDLVSGKYLKSSPECPAGGVYAWVPGAEGSPGYQSEIGCSVHGAQAADENKIAYNFDGGNSDGWFKSSNNWEVIDGKYYGGIAGKNSGENRTFMQDILGSDYTMEADVKLISGSGGYGYGVYFRASDYEKTNTLDSYVFQYDPGWNGGSFLYRKVVNGAESNPIVQVKAPVGYQWTGTEKHIKIDVSGNTFKAYVSDISGGTTPVLQLTDSTFSSGTAGLRTWNNSYASFDNITVKQAAAKK